MISKAKLKQYLIEFYPNKFDRKKTLEAWLIRFICQDYGYEPASKLKDITHHGCSSGCVGELIYTYDCRRFYDHFEKQIWDVIEEFRDNTGQTLGQFIDSFRDAIENEDTLKTYLSWFAIEETAFKILNHFEEE